MVRKLFPAMALPLLLLMGQTGAAAELRLIAKDPAALRGGERVTVAWSAPPREVEELELLLSLDNGRSYALRLTPSLGPEQHALAWIVPNLPAERARLRLRIGIAGREFESEESLPFYIAFASETALEALDFRDGEWWTAAASAQTPIPPPGLTGDPQAFGCAFR